MSVVAWRIKGDWERFCSHDTLMEPDIRAFAESVLLRDRLTCRCCGFSSRRSKQISTGYMELRPIDGNYDGREPFHWETVCPFCHAAFKMTDALNSGRFRVISAPWVTQAELSNILRPVLIVLKDVDHLYYAEALQVYKSFLSAESAVAALLPNIPATENTPAENLRRYFNLLDSVIDDSQYEHRHLFASSLRVMPDKAYFKDELAYWDAAIFSNYPLSKWERLAAWKCDQQLA